MVKSVNSRLFCKHQLSDFNHEFTIIHAEKAVMRQQQQNARPGSANVDGASPWKEASHRKLAVLTSQSVAVDGGTSTEGLCESGTVAALLCRMKQLWVPASVRDL